MATQVMGFRHGPRGIEGQLDGRGRTGKVPEVIEADVHKLTRPPPRSWAGRRNIGRRYEDYPRLPPSSILLSYPVDSLLCTKKPYLNRSVIR